MTIYERIRHIITFRINRAKKNISGSVPFLRMKLKYFLPLGIYDAVYLETPLEEGWYQRIQDVVDCPDNRLIPRHPEAGLVKKGKQVMHNGIVVTLGGYYGHAIAQMLYKNKGVHEPQEEYAFDQVLHTIPENATMLEFGSYWAFYSIWFQKRIKNARNYMVEPEFLNMLYGINNFRLNEVRGKFTNAFIGRAAGNENGIPIICVDDYVAENHIDFIDILHSDIQGFEYDMLVGAENTIRENKIGYVFISTHGNKVHAQCLDFLLAKNFKILCSADEQDTYSFDGLIVARANNYPGLDNIDIALKTKATAN